MTILLDTVKKVRDFNKIAISFPSEIFAASGRYLVSAKSLMGLFSLNLSNSINIKCENEEYTDLMQMYFKRFEVSE